MKRDIQRVTCNAVEMISLMVYTSYQMIFAIFADKKIHNSLTKFNKHGPAMLPTKKAFYS